MLFGSDGYCQLFIFLKTLSDVVNQFFTDFVRFNVIGSEHMVRVYHLLFKDGDFYLSLHSLPTKRSLWDFAL
jgi:hypothetical protein